MIGKLKGILAEVDGNMGLIETTGGVFYQVSLPPRLASASNILSPIEVYTYTHVREDVLALFGFENKRDYELFILLLTVPSVGPKTAYSVISMSQYDDLIDAIRGNKIEYFKRIPGLGSKTAIKIILELSQKLKSEFIMEKMYLSEDDQTVVDALISLGFKSAEAKSILQKIPKDLSVEKRISEGIKLATNKK